MTNLDETMLLRLFTQNGNAAAFSEITHRYADLVYGTCLRITGDPERARDAAQDTFLQLFKQAGEIAGSLGGWLHKVATRRSVDLIRRESARRQREEAFATDLVRETDSWNDISPLVDEAMTELEPDQRELLVQRFLQGQTTVHMAELNGVSQPTMSRRIDAALEQLRQRLRKKGLGVPALALGTMLVSAVNKAPAAVVVELGKMALASSSLATANTAPMLSKVKLSIAAGLAVAAIGGYFTWQAVHAANPTSSQLTSEAPNSPAAGQQGQEPGMMREGGMGRAMEDALPPAIMIRGTLIRFTTLLAQGGPDQTVSCFAGIPEAQAFQRSWANPANDKERNLQIALPSLLPSSVEILATNPVNGQLIVKWCAEVRRPFTLVQTGTSRTWQPGNTVVLETQVKQIDGIWKIVGF